MIIKKMAINNKIKRTMLENKSQYLGSLILIIISCMTFTMFNLLTSNMSSLMASFQKDYVQEDASFTTDKKLNDIDTIETKFNMKIEEMGSFDYQVSKNKTLRVFSQDTKVDIPAVVEGSNLKEGSILIDPAYAKANKLKVGDNIRIQDKTFNISGFMALPNNIYVLKSDSDIINDPASFGIAVISKGDFNSFNQGTSYYAVKFKGNKTSIDNQTAQFKEYLKNKNIIIVQWTNIDENPKVTYVNAKMDSINQMSTSMPIAILLLTCILTAVVMRRMLKKESIIIGTLYALGYKKKEIRRHYLSYPLSVALAGGITGTALGAVTLKPMLNVMIGYFNIPVSTVNFSAQCIIISIMLPIVFLGLFGYLVIDKTLKSAPVDLMRGGKENNKVNFIEKNLKLDKFKFAAKFKIREQLRSIPRSAFLLFGVIFATMLLLLGFVAKSSIDTLMKDTYESTYKYQYQYIFNSLKQGTPVKGEAFSLSPFTLKSGNSDKNNFSVYGVNPDTSYIYLKDSSGKKLNMDKIIITKPLAEKLKVKPGDTIEVVNKLDSRDYRIRIDSIADTYVGEYIYMPIDKFNIMLNYPSGSYFGLWSKERIVVPERELLSSLTIEDSRKALDTITMPMQMYVGVIAFISFFIGLIIIYVVTSLIIEENKESISLMKVLGYKKKEINSLILNSSTFIIILGYILGVPLLLVSLSAMFSSVTKSMNFAFPVTIEYSYLFIGFVIIYFTFWVSKALSKRKINRISMTEALKAVE